MDWPASLVTELAARRCLVFIGAGASAGCVSADGAIRPPLWGAFLNRLKQAMPLGSDLSAIDSLMGKERFLDAAEIIVNKLPQAEFTRVVRDLLVKPKFLHSKVHEAILEIDPKVVVTTNYDDVYDNYCRSGQAQDGYNVCKYYDDHLVNDLRSPIRLVLKSHGCITDVSKIVLTRSSYFKQKQMHPNFFSVLDALFVTNTILFIGYRINDPDIQLILENSNIAARSLHRHYALVEDSMHPDIEAASTFSYNIDFLKFPTGDYGSAEASLFELAELVKQFRATNPS